MIVLYPGSFDPITVGHVDVIRKAVKAFGQITILVMDNENKKHKFSQPSRVNMINESLKRSDLKDNCGVLSSQGWISDFIDDNVIIIRGLRNGTDFDYEMTYEQFTTSHGATTLYFTPTPSNAYVSSSLVRNLIDSRGDYSQYVCWQ